MPFWVKDYLTNPALRRRMTVRGLRKSMTFVTVGVQRVNFWIQTTGQTPILLRRRPPELGLAPTAGQPLARG